MSQAALHLTTQLPDRPLTVDPQKWIPVGEAATRLRIEKNHLGRRCKTELSPKGLAVMAQPDGGGNETWHLIRSWDMRLTAGRVGELYQVPTLSQYTQQQRLRAQQRVACVDAFRTARATWKGNQKDWIARLIDQLCRMYPELSISRTSLLRWQGIYNTPSDLEKLVDTRGGNRKGAADPAAWKMFKDLFLDDKEPSRRDCWRVVRDAAKQYDWRWLTYSACCDQLKAHIPPEVQTQFRRPRQYLRQCRPYVIKNPNKWAAGECWEGDHRQLNVICRLGPSHKLIRPWLTAWIDYRSRRLTGWVLSEQPNSTTILAALRAGLKDKLNHGGPHALWIDNGKDYDSYTLHGATKRQRKQRIAPNVDVTQTGGVLARLGIDAHFAIPHNPNGKPHIERWFDTLEPFDKRFVTYTARNSQDKPESLALALKDRHKVPRFKHVLEALAEHIEGYNKATGNDRDSQWMDNVLEGLSPDDYMLQHCPHVRPLPRDADLDLLMQKHHKPVRVARNGITINIAGKTVSYGMSDILLKPLKGGGRDEHGHKDQGQLVNVTFDPDDITDIYVWTLDWAIIGKVRMNSMVANDDRISESDYKDQMRETRNYIKASKHTKEYAIHQLMTNEQQINARKKRDQQAIDQELATKPMKFVQRPDNSPSNELQKQEARKAAGAEAYHNRDEFDLMAELAHAQRLPRDSDSLEPLHFESPDHQQDEPDDKPLNLNEEDDDAPGEFEETFNLGDALATIASDPRTPAPAPAPAPDDETIDLSLMASAACADDDGSSEADRDVLSLSTWPDASMDENDATDHLLDLMP